MFKKLLVYINQQTTWGEIMRFVLVGGLATVIDFAVSGIILYIAEPSLYPIFIEAFYTDRASDLVSIIATGGGFLVGLLSNYILSIIFIFIEKGNSKTVGGFIKFAFLSAIGLAIHLIGMWLLKPVLGFWIPKIFLTLLVLFYNYITRKLFVFKKDKHIATQPTTAETTNQNNLDSSNENSNNSTLNNDDNKALNNESER